MGKLALSMEEDQAALRIREKALPPDHPDLALSYSNVAASLADFKRYDEAIPLFEKALAIVEKRLGVEHPSYSETLLSMGVTLGLAGRLPEAEATLRRAKNLSARVLGPGHTQTNRAADLLARTLIERHRYAEAAAELAPVIQAFESPDAERTDLAVALEDVANAWWPLGRHAEAIAAAKRARAIHRERKDATPVLDAWLASHH